MAAKARETQALLGTLQFCFKSPTLLGLELVWRWLYGVPALWWLWNTAVQIGALIPPDTLADLQAKAYVPMQASVVLASIALIIWPAVVQALWRVALPLLVGWVIVSSAGRLLVAWRLRRLRPELVSAINLRLWLRWLLLQAARVALLVLAFGIFFRITLWAGADAFTPGEPPNLVLYLTEVTVTGIAVFAAWAVLSYVVSVAPAVALEHPELTLRGILRSASRVKGAIEVNLVLGIVKLALMVLAMVFSAVPIPFESEVPPQQLHIWWALVSIWYLAANDFFQVARFVEMLRLSRREAVS